MRPSIGIVTLTMLAACGGLAYVYANRDAPADSSTEAATAQRVPALATATDEVAPTDVSDESTDATNTALPEAATPPTIEQLIKDTESSHARKRAEAIAALANAPKAQALPALKQVLDSGEPEVDRHIALRALHTLALRDGDDNGAVRDVMRHAIYHGDDDGVTQTAQSLLDDVEAALAESQQQPN